MGTVTGTSSSDRPVDGSYERWVKVTTSQLCMHESDVLNAIKEAELDLGITSRVGELTTGAYDILTLVAPTAEYNGDVVLLYVLHHLRSVRKKVDVRMDGFLITESSARVLYEYSLLSSGTGARLIRVDLSTSHVSDCAKAYLMSISHESLFEVSLRDTAFEEMGNGGATPETCLQGVACRVSRAKFLLSIVLTAIRTLDPSYPDIRAPLLEYARLGMRDGLMLVPSIEMCYSEFGSLTLQDWMTESKLLSDTVMATCPQGSKVLLPSCSVPESWARSVFYSHIQAELSCHKEADVHRPASRTLLSSGSGNGKGRGARVVVLNEKGYDVSVVSSRSESVGGNSRAFLDVRVTLPSLDAQGRPQHLVSPWSNSIARSKWGKTTPTNPYGWNATRREDGWSDVYLVGAGSDGSNRTYSVKYYTEWRHSRDTHGMWITDLFSKGREGPFSGRFDIELPVFDSLVPPSTVTRLLLVRVDASVNHPDPSRPALVGLSKNVANVTLYRRRDVSSGSSAEPVADGSVNHVDAFFLVATPLEVYPSSAALGCSGSVAFRSASVAVISDSSRHSSLVAKYPHMSNVCSKNEWGRFVQVVDPSGTNPVGETYILVDQYMPVRYAVSEGPAVETCRTSAMDALSGGIPISSMPPCGYSGTFSSLDGIVAEPVGGQSIDSVSFSFRGMGSGRTMKTCTDVVDLGCSPDSSEIRHFRRLSVVT